MGKSIVMFLAAVIVGVAFGGIRIKDGETVAFLGDSITANGQHNHDGYVNRVLRALACEGVKVKAVKAGVSGSKSNDMLERLDQRVLSHRPHWMTLSCGVNDVWHQDRGRGVLLEDYKKNITQILDKCVASNCTVIVMTATPFTRQAGKGRAGVVDARALGLRQFAQGPSRDAAHEGLRARCLVAVFRQCVSGDGVRCALNAAPSVFSKEEFKS